MRPNLKNRSRQRFWLAIAVIITLVDFFTKIAFPHSSRLPNWIDVVMFLLAVGALYMSLCVKIEK
jgi:uncharacterized membrane protein YhaH (DUF805 family)